VGAFVASLQQIMLHFCHNGSSLSLHTEFIPVQIKSAVSVLILICWRYEAYG
jgi:hypothetical protein